MFLFQVTGYAQLLSKTNANKPTGWFNKKRVDSLNGKPISYYLNHKGIDSYSKAFYKGKFPIFDDLISNGIMDSVLTNNNSTRPFYLYNFNRMLELVDAAAAEEAGLRALEYFQKYPCEFVRSLKDKKYNADIEKWSSLIGYELGLSDEIPSFNKHINAIEKKLKTNCNDCLNKDWHTFKRLLKQDYELVQEN